MADYRLYCLDANGRIVRRLDLEASDDDSAVSIARERVADAGCELWAGSRKVAVLPKVEQPAS